MFYFIVIYICNEYIFIVVTKPISGLLSNQFSIIIWLYADNILYVDFSILSGCLYCKNSIKRLPNKWIEERKTLFRLTWCSKPFTSYSSYGRISWLRTLKTPAHLARITLTSWRHNVSSRKTTGTDLSLWVQLRLCVHYCARDSAPLPNFLLTVVIGNWAEKN